MATPTAPRGRGRPLVLGHRGASADAPENTLAAFRLALAQGADGVELDVWRCATGEVVVVHDEDLRRVAGLPVRVPDATLAELRAADVGAWKGEAFRGERVPLLEEVLSALPAAVVNVERTPRGRRRARDRVLVRLAAARRVPPRRAGRAGGPPLRRGPRVARPARRRAAAHGPLRRPPRSPARHAGAPARLERARPRRERVDGRRTGGGARPRAPRGGRDHHERAGADPRGGLSAGQNSQPSLNAPLNADGILTLG